MHVGRVHVATNHGLQLAGRGLDLGHGQNKLGGFIIIILVIKRELLTATTWAGALIIDIYLSLHPIRRESACPELPCTF
jgi:hypothetical protein